MDPTERFVAEANIARFSNMLYGETDPEVRDRLQELLVTEENRFASRSLRLEMADRCIAEASTRVDRQMRKIAELHDAGNDAVHLRRTLANSISVLEVFKAFRAMVSENLDRAEL